MVQIDNIPGPSNRDIFEASLSGAQERPFIPRLRSDPPPYHPLPHSLLEFRQQEGEEERDRRFRELWRRLPKRTFGNIDDEAISKSIPVMDDASLTPERAKKLQEMYEDELVGSCNSHGLGSIRPHIGWKEFKRYAERKEAELWSIFHDELDLDGNGHLDAEELEVALRKAGIEMSPSTMSEFMTSLTQSPHSHSINFREFRDFLLLMPRKASTAEIYRFYEVKRYLDDDRRGAARVNMEGDVSLSAEDRPHAAPIGYKAHTGRDQLVDYALESSGDEDDDNLAPEEYEEEHHSWLGGTTAVKFLLAGGIAGAVSRTCTAPFDRLKIFLITRPPEMGGTSLSPAAPVRGVKAIGNAVARIYAESGIRGFWVGNGLSVAKIFPESAIKFLAYESSKRFFAEYVDHVEDSREITGVSRFLSGGIGGITSQLSIYPIETLKTQMMSSTGEQRRTLIGAARRVWQLGGIRAYYRGLTIGLIGVFPYSAIDMSTFEALKLAYLRSTGKDEPGVLATLAFGSVSGSVASGSSGHPERYTGILDVATKTYQRDGWRGFYRGLLPTLAKVVPAVSISYVVYEHSKRKYVPG
ncbi:hypothetical protein GLOTRDRAFT_34751 [Gloeophyllum trabeum ATCC 11539]|uniref:EF-hand domain-containing protein n=1 Tax=Gloeophyllum trabeum (strain ATCC 11539 / FP-39264 / Madison 617) TaxID=670483 RepID=S7RY74_GLOTA|nr:uncharacterized protein GLOTRDRAFT_34751 [Gloeophyllum trabeum ATCC 11539]EPQ59905.1 hypothetical protein GLOTRDRAFT_34751 [Gloeophyllum trabeum ATCC 11539]